MKNGGDGKSSFSSKSAGIGGGSVKKPPKEISVQIDADSEDADDVPPAPSAARALRFSRKQAEKMVILFPYFQLFHTVLGRSIRGKSNEAIQKAAKRLRSGRIRH